MPRPLKVFCTAIGFHDAYVAAPTQKAALDAWGSDKNLFASGRAEIVTDAALTKAPLATPGKVIKVRRGTDRENLAALPRKPAGESRPAAAPERAPRSSRPSRAAFDRAETAVEKAKIAKEKEVGAIDDQIRMLQERRRSVAAKHDARLERLIAARDEAEAVYDAAMEDWREIG